MEAEPNETVMTSAAASASQSIISSPSAVKAGWLCLAVGALTFWLFGIGYAFFAAAFVLAIVAMCTNRVGHGFAL